MSVLLVSLETIFSLFQSRVDKALAERYTVTVIIALFQFLLNC